MEVNERNLKRLALVGGFFGLVILFFYSGNMELMPVNSLDGYSKDNAVVLQGKIERVSWHDEVAFLEIEAQVVEVTPVILFVDRELWLHEGDYVQIEGTVEEYEGELELIGHSVEVLGREEFVE